MSNCYSVISLFSLLALTEKILKCDAKNDIVFKPILITVFGICYLLECLKLQVFVRVWKVLSIEGGHGLFSILSISFIRMMML